MQAVFDYSLQLSKILLIQQYCLDFSKKNLTFAERIAYTD